MQSKRLDVGPALGARRGGYLASYSLLVTTVAGIGLGAPSERRLSELLALSEPAPSGTMFGHTAPRPPEPDVRAILDPYCVLCHNQTARSRGSRRTSSIRRPSPPAPSRRSGCRSPMCTQVEGWAPQLAPEDTLGLVAGVAIDPQGRVISSWGANQFYGLTASPSTAAATCGSPTSGCIM
jgi:hypothetical protein